MYRRPPSSPSFPSPPLCRPVPARVGLGRLSERNAPRDKFELDGLELQEARRKAFLDIAATDPERCVVIAASAGEAEDRKSTRLNSSHANISYAVFCLKKKKQ